MSLNDVEDLDKRAADIAYCCFRFDLTGHIFDSCLENAGSTSILYALKFPSHLYDPSTHAFTLTNVPTPQPISPRQFTNRSLNLMAEAASLASAQDNSQAPQTPTPSSRTTPAGFSSPKMKMMVGSGSSQSVLKQGYYGPFDFFDNQANFHAVFGNQPGILCFMPLRTDMADVVKGQLREFCDKCKLDIFLSIMQLDYIGADSDVDESISTIAVCRQIQKLSQEVVENSHSILLRPELLANQFTSLTTNLPDNATQWTMQLHATYVAALSEELSDAIGDDTSFKILDAKN